MCSKGSWFRVIFTAAMSTGRRDSLGDYKRGLAAVEPVLRHAGLRECLPRRTHGPRTDGTKPDTTTIAIRVELEPCARRKLRVRLRTRWQHAALQRGTRRWSQVQKRISHRHERTVRQLTVPVKNTGEEVGTSCIALQDPVHKYSDSDTDLVTEIGLTCSPQRYSQPKRKHLTHSGMLPGLHSTW